MVVAFWFIAAFLLEFVICTLPRRSKRQTRVRLYPKEEIIDKICRTIGLATDSSNDWNTYEVKREAIEQLESLAECVEVEFFESVAAMDAPTAEWRRNKLKRSLAYPPFETGDSRRYEPQP